MMLQSRIDRRSRQESCYQTIHLRWEWTLRGMPRALFAHVTFMGTGKSACRGAQDPDIIRD